MLTTMTPTISKVNPSKIRINKLGGHLPSMHIKRPLKTASSLQLYEPYIAIDRVLQTPTSTIGQHFVAWDGDFNADVYANLIATPNSFVPFDNVLQFLDQLYDNKPLREEFKKYFYLVDAEVKDQKDQDNYKLTLMAYAINKLDNKSPKYRQLQYQHSRYYSQFVSSDSYRLGIIEVICICVIFIIVGTLVISAIF